jgi:hypothetical protein
VYTVAPSNKAACLKGDHMRTPSRPRLVHVLTMSWLIVVPAGSAGAAELVLNGVRLATEYAGFVHREGSLRDFEKTHPGLGASVAYDLADKGVASVYVYSQRLTQIPDGVDSILTVGEFGRSSREVTEVAPSLARTAEFVGNCAVEISRATGFLCAEFIIRDRRGARRSFLYLTAASDRFIKLRITMDDDVPGDPRAHAFAAALGKGLRQSR